MKEGKKIASTDFNVHVLQEIELIGSSMEEGEQVKLMEDKVTQIAQGLEDVQRTYLITCLIRNVDVFASGIHDLIGVVPSLIEHRLNIALGVRPVKQKK